MYYVPCTISVQMVLENENLYEAYMYLWIGIRNLKRFNEYFVSINKIKAIDLMELSSSW